MRGSLFGGTTIRDFRLRGTRSPPSCASTNSALPNTATHLDASRRERVSSTKSAQRCWPGGGGAAPGGWQAAQSRARCAYSLKSITDAISTPSSPESSNSHMSDCSSRSPTRSTRRIGGADPHSADAPVPRRPRLADRRPNRVRFGQPSGRPGDITNRNGIEIVAPDGHGGARHPPGTVSSPPVRRLRQPGDRRPRAQRVVALRVPRVYGRRRGTVVDGATELGRVGSARRRPAL